MWWWFYVKLVNCPLSLFPLEHGLQQRESITITYKKKAVAICLLIFTILYIQMAV